MFNNEHLSDVKFVVRGNDGESESRRSITAHKFVLSIGSPVFEAMFYGELAETKDTIQLPDIDYESFFVGVVSSSLQRRSKLKRK